MTTERVMMLIDADNVSVDVMEQGLRLMVKQHGGVHVRRAYCTAESAVKHQAFFKRMGIKPMVNLAAGKNSTDIALAVDAIDLVLAERPDVVVIASSDSDFAPLVQRLREKGCVVRGIGQKGKTGDETVEVYDDYTVIEHRKSAAAPRAAERQVPARKAAARGERPERAERGERSERAERGEGRGRARGEGRTEGRADTRVEARSEVRQERAVELPFAETPAAAPEPVVLPMPAPVEVAIEAPAADEPLAVAAEPADEPAPKKTAARKAAAAKKAPAAKKTPAAKKAPAAKKVAAAKKAPVAKKAAAPRKTKAAAVAETVEAVEAAEAAAVAPVPAVVPPPPPPPPAPEPVPVPVAAPAPRGPASGSRLQQVLRCLPELGEGRSLALNVAVQRLREAQLLGKNSSSLKLFSQLSDRFELLPPGKPSQVSWRP